MHTINKADVPNYVVSGEFDIPASFSADEDSKKAGDSKSVTLRFKMEAVSLADIIASSLKDKRINIQTSLRKKPEQYKNGQILHLDYKGGRQPVDPEVAFMARLAAMTPEAREAKIAELKAKFNK